MRQHKSEKNQDYLPRWYETIFDYHYRIRNVPEELLPPVALLTRRHVWTEESLLELIDKTRIDQIKEIAFDTFFDNIPDRETISPETIKFDVRNGKNYKTGWKKICMDNEHYVNLSCSPEFKSLLAN
jgi:hypothetical protein